MTTFESLLWVDYIIIKVGSRTGQDTTKYVTVKTSFPKIRDECIQYSLMQTVPHEFMTHQLLFKFYGRKCLKSPNTLSCTLNSGSQVFMEILYARVQHIIAMNQGIQMLNAV